MAGLTMDATRSSDACSVPFDHLLMPHRDNVGGRALQGANTAGNTMTGQQCVKFCADRGYYFAGTEYSQECYCGFALRDTSTKRPESECNMGCSGIRP